MAVDPKHLAARLTTETGLELSGTVGRELDGTSFLQLRPAGHTERNAFSLRTRVKWRRLEVEFHPDTFAGDLVASMGNAEEASREIFRSVLNTALEEGAEVVFAVNGVSCEANADVWDIPWKTLRLALSRGMLPINKGDAETDSQLIEKWTLRLAAAAFALLPLETDDNDLYDDVSARMLPEGGKARIEVNRYERDRRNRAAALAIHGYRCKACGTDMGKRYGRIAAGLIEVHHVVPVSAMRPGYHVDPRLDLVPLCPSCHAVVHRRVPPFSVDEVQRMLRDGGGR